MNEKEIYKTFMGLLEEAMNMAIELDMNTWISDERKKELEKEFNNRLNFLKLYVEKNNMENNKDNHISENTTLEQIEKIYKDVLDGELKSIYIEGDDKFKEIIERLFSNYDVEIVLI